MCCQEHEELLQNVRLYHHTKTNCQNQNNRITHPILLPLHIIASYKIYHALRKEIDLISNVDCFDNQLTNNKEQNTNNPTNSSQRPSRNHHGIPHNTYINIQTHKTSCVDRPLYFFQGKNNCQSDNQRCFLKR